MKHSMLIIPIFLSQSGCPHQCVFCNQKNITNKRDIPSPEKIRETICLHLNTWKGKGGKEVAFYGGTFTSLDIKTQEGLLKEAYYFIREGLIDSLRISTRPDAIDDERLNLLKKYKVKTVELGVQSMDDSVLERAGRGHSSDNTRNAIRLLKRDGFRIGIQIMPGLPGDTSKTILYTAYEIIGIRPDFIRVYPTLVIKDTPLEKMFLDGMYKPWSLEDMVSVCREVIKLFDKHKIPVIRIGLQTTNELLKNIVAGPFHPSFRQLLA